MLRVGYCFADRVIDTVQPEAPKALYAMNGLSRFGTEKRTIYLLSRGGASRQYAKENRSTTVLCASGRYRNIVFRLYGYACRYCRVCTSYFELRADTPQYIVHRRVVTELAEELDVWHNSTSYQVCGKRPAREVTRIAMLARHASSWSG